MRGAQARDFLSIWVGRRVVTMSSETINQKNARVAREDESLFLHMHRQIWKCSPLLLKKALSPQEVYFLQSQVLFLRE